MKLAIVFGAYKKEGLTTSNLLVLDELSELINTTQAWQARFGTGQFHRDIKLSRLEAEMDELKEEDGS